MSHQIGKERNIIELLQEIFGKTVPERMGINHLFVHAILVGIILKLLRYATSRNSFSKSIQKKVAGSALLVV